MRLKTRVKRLENKFERTKPLLPVTLVYEIAGETVESEHNEYLDRGGDPNAEITYLIYRNPLGRPYPKFDKDLE